MIAGESIHCSFCQQSVTRFYIDGVWVYCTFEPVFLWANGPMDLNGTITTPTRVPVALTSLQLIVHRCQGFESPLPDRLKALAP